MPSPDEYDPNAPAVPDELREKLFTKPSHALGEPTKALANALRDNATLRARIGELEASLSLAEKVCEALVHYKTYRDNGPELLEILAAWRAQKS